MLSKARYAILLDGGFVKQKLNERLGRHPTAEDVYAECARLKLAPCVADYELLRIYYYDAYPSSESVKRPVSKDLYESAKSERFLQSEALYRQLILKPDMALRMGTVNLLPTKWRIKDSTVTQLKRSPRPLADQDFVIAAQQKGVDMRIGMDMARLALRDMVRAMIVVTGDQDFIPAFKFVRREGVKVILDLMGENGRLELKEHSDILLDR